MPSVQARTALKICKHVAMREDTPWQRDGSCWPALGLCRMAQDGRTDGSGPAGECTPVVCPAAAEDCSRRASSLAFRASTAASRSWAALCCCRSLQRPPHLIQSHISQAATTHVKVLHSVAHTTFHRSLLRLMNDRFAEQGQGCIAHLCSCCCRMSLTRMRFVTAGVISFCTESAQRNAF